MPSTSPIGARLDKIVAWSLDRPLPPLYQYLITTLAILIVAVVRMLAITSLVPWLLFIPAILIIALLFGERRGLYAAALAALLAGLSIGSPENPYWLKANQWFASILFMAVAIGVAALAGALRSALHRGAIVNRRLIDAQRQQRLLTEELGHRLKNVLAVVQAVASQTFKSAHDLSEANRLFGARLASLGEATDVLTRSEWAGATLAEAVKAGLTPVAGTHRQIDVDGPTVELSPQITLAMTLAIHELATNATKYGALSVESGHVRISWEVRPGQQLCFLWEESGGPLVVPPTRHGFGSRMIERSLSSYFKGETRLVYEPSGVKFSISAPLGGARLTIKDDN